jgi:perosamine synthetase
MLGSKAFIPLMIPDIQQQDIDAVVDVLKSGNLVQGEKVAELEIQIAKYIGIKHAVAVSNGTASLHIALIALGIGKGDEVIVPSFSYVATANVLELVGATPIFVDIDISTFNIDIALIESKITSRTKAIMPVHEFGLACDISEIYKIARKYKIPVIEDAACALGATENKKFAGTFGEIGSFSFHPRKNITSGEGGVLVTNSDELAEKFRVLRNHGISMSSGKMEFIEAGFNYRMTDFQAALVLSQLHRIEEIIKYKAYLANIYHTELSNCNRIKLPKTPLNKRHTWQSFHVLFDRAVDRNALMKNLFENGIGTNYGAQCIPEQVFYKNKYGFDCEKHFPNSLYAYEKGLVLPLYSKLNLKDVCFISENLLIAITDTNE